MAFINKETIRVSELARLREKEASKRILAFTPDKSRREAFLCLRKRFPNLQRTWSVKEKREKSLNDIATELGRILPKDKVATFMAKYLWELGSEPTIRNPLSAEYKESHRVDNARKKAGHVSAKTTASTFRRQQKSEMDRESIR